MPAAPPSRFIDDIKDDLIMAGVTLSCFVFLIGVFAAVFHSLPYPVMSWSNALGSARIESVTLCEDGSAVKTVSPDRRVLDDALVWDELEDALKQTLVEFDEEGFWPASGTTYTIALDNTAKGARELYVLDAGHVWAEGTAYVLFDDGRLYRKCGELLEGSVPAHGSRGQKEVKSE